MRLIVAWACRGGAAVRHCRRNVKKNIERTAMSTPLRQKYPSRWYFLIVNFVSLRNREGN